MVNHIEYIIAVSTFLSSTLGAAIGLGGGILLIPFLHIGAKMPLAQTIQISYFIVLFNSIRSSALNFEGNLIDLPTARPLIIASVIGSVFGILFLRHLPEVYIYAVYALIVIVSAYGLSKDVLTKNPSASPKAAKLGTYRAQNQSFGAVCFVIAGMIASALGIGAGVLKIPVMDRLMKIPFRISSATSSYMAAFSVSIPALVSLFSTQTPIAYFSWAIVGGAIGTTIGNRFLQRSPIRLLRVVFICFLIFVLIQTGIKIYALV